MFGNRSLSLCVCPSHFNILKCLLCGYPFATIFTREQKCGISTLVEILIDMEQEKANTRGSSLLSLLRVRCLYIVQKVC